MNTNGEECAACGARPGKLKYCGGCGLVAYCNQDCQKRDRKAHKSLCKLSEEIPSEGESLSLDPEERIDFDTPLLYAIKHMEDLKHICITIDQSACLNLHNPLGEPDRPIKIDPKNVRELLRERTKLQCFELHIDDGCEDHTRRLTGGGKLWQELEHQPELRALTLTNPVFSDPAYLNHLPKGLELLGLHSMTLGAVDHEWEAEAKPAVLTKISSLTSLVSLTLDGGHLKDSDLIFLQTLPNLRSLNLGGQFGENVDSGDTGLSLTDDGCKMIADACPHLQQLELSHNREITKAGVRYILENCKHLRELRVAVARLSLADLVEILPVSRTLLLLSFGDASSTEKANSTGLLNDAIKCTGGRTLLMSDFDGMLKASGLSEDCEERAAESMRLLEEASDRGSDWRVINEFDWLYGQ